MSLLSLPHYFHVNANKCLFSRWCANDGRRGSESLMRESRVSRTEFLLLAQFSLCFGYSNFASTFTHWNAPSRTRTSCQIHYIRIYYFSRNDLATPYFTIYASLGNLYEMKTEIGKIAFSLPSWHWGRRLRTQSTSISIAMKANKCWSRGKHNKMPINIYWMFALLRIIDWTSPPVSSLPD